MSSDKTTITIVTDCDGILTTPHFSVSTEGTVMKNFSVNDSLVVKKLLPYVNSELHKLSNEIEKFDLICLTGAPTKSYEITKSRVQDYMGIQVIECPNNSKWRWIDDNLPWNNVIYIGDDIYDLPILEDARYGVTVNSAPDILKHAADYVSSRNGGDSAFTDIVLYILQHRFGINISEMIRSQAYNPGL